MHVKYIGDIRTFIFFAAFFLGINAYSTTGILSEDCYNDLLSRLNEHPTSEQVATIVTMMNKRDLRCLYNASLDLGAPNIDFFLPDPNRPQEVTILSGKNSMPFANVFEKHVFPVEDTLTEKINIYGYNFHSAIRFTGPGFFKVIPFENFVLFDFTGNFVREIPKDVFSSFSGTKTDVPCNNNCNLIYGGDMHDYCHRLIYDEKTGKDIAIVCEAHRTFLGLIRVPFLWDILIRQD